MKNQLKPVRFAMVGLNYGRHILSKLFASPAGLHFELAAVCDSDTVKAREAAIQFEVPGFTAYDELLRQPDLDAVAIFTGPAGRAEIIRKALRAGKHVLTTKPFETDAEAAQSVLREARERGLAVHLNSPGPSIPPDLALIRAWQHQHDLGRPIAAHAHVWARHHEKADGSWYDDPARCPLGPVFRIGIYLLNDMLFCCGPVRRVQVLESRLFTQRPVTDNALAGLLFENGAIGSIFSSFCIEDGDAYRNSIAFNFENGTIYKNFGEQREDMTLYGSELSLVKTAKGKRTTVEQTCISDGSGTYQWEAFWQVVNAGALNGPADESLIVESIRLIQALSRAATGNGFCNVH